MSDEQAVDLSNLGTRLQMNQSVRRIYTALDANDDGSWDVVTIIETTLELDPDSPGHRADEAERLVQDIEADLRNGVIWGRVKIETIGAGA